MRAKAIPRLAAWSATGALAALAGCSTILGFEELSPIPEDASAPQQDAASEQMVQEAATADSQTGEDATATQDQTSGDAPTQDQASDGAATQDQASGDAPTQDATPHPCLDTQSDPYNCGTCGHDCLGGKCLTGVCQPVELLGGLNEPVDLVELENDLLVALNQDQGVIYRVPKAGGPKTDFAKGEYTVDYPCAMTVDSTHVYFSNCGNEGGDIRRCPINGCPDPEWLVNANHASALVRKDDRLFWAEMATGKVWSMVVTGGVNGDAGAPMDAGDAGDAGGPVDLGANASSLEPHRMIEHDGYLYVSNKLNMYFSIDRLRVDGGGFETIDNQMVSRPWGLASGGGYIFWATQGTTWGQVWRWQVGSDAGSATTLIQNQQDPYDVAADDQFVYWAVTGGVYDTPAGKIFSCPVSGCGGAPARVLAAEQAQPWRIVPGKKAIYWANKGVVTNGGSVWMVAR